MKRDDVHFVMVLTNQSSLKVLGTSSIFVSLRQKQVTDGRSYFGIEGTKHRCNAEEGFHQLLRCVSPDSSSMGFQLFTFSLVLISFVNSSYSIITWFVELIT
jgi:hypothetical protein